MELDTLTGLLDTLTGRWPQVLSLFAGLALAAGLLGMLTRALGAKRDDGFKGLFRRGKAAGRVDPSAPEGKSKLE